MEEMIVFEVGDVVGDETFGPPSFIDDVESLIATTDGEIV